MNFGSLGFLTEVTLSEMYSALEAAIGGTAPIESRMMLRVRVEHQPSPGALQCVADRVVLNDVVVTQGALSRVIDLSVSVDGEFMMRIRADGVIVASPTGSTAYNLSSGGPILHPRVDGINITPIAPHTLTNRPIMIPAHEVIEVRPRIERGADIYITYDGQEGYPLQIGDMVRVRCSARTLRLVKSPSRTYFQVLREKLNWGERGH